MSETKGNLYREGQWENETIRYPDGTVRSVPVKKVKDTAGTEIYVLGDETPLQ